MLTRRELLLGTGAALLPLACGRAAEAPANPQWVNDVHSQLNRTRVIGIAQPSSTEEVRALVREARAAGRGLSVAGSRHAMGGQQFGTDTVLIDGRALRGFELDPDSGTVEVGAGVEWPELIEQLVAQQGGGAGSWGIVQKQTGADRLSIGGALSANAHGRGLALKPIVGDVEAFTLVDAVGDVHRCSRTENAELFGLAIGGYGLFGVITSVRLRLAPRRKLERVVEVGTIADLSQRFADRIAQGYLFGDFQYSTDLASDGLLREGVFSCYRPVDPDTPMPREQAALSRDDWMGLLALAHLDRAEAFRRYASYYQGTSGQLYWSDTHQLSTYIEDYHRLLASRLGERASGTEMISELYVPRTDLARFLEQVRADFLAHRVNLIYGTIRLTLRDDETFLPWASQSWACVIFNLHTQHDPAALEQTADHFRRLIEIARGFGGSYFLTYHRWAEREQVLACYPQFPAFLAAKLRYDPEERIQSDWYRHYRDLFA